MPIRPGAAKGTRAGATGRPLSAVGADNLWRTRRYDGLWPNADIRRSSEVGSKVRDAVLQGRTPERPAREDLGNPEKERRIRAALGIPRTPHAARPAKCPAGKKKAPVGRGLRLPGGDAGIRSGLICKAFCQSLRVCTPAYTPNETRRTGVQATSCALVTCRRVPTRQSEMCRWSRVEDMTSLAYCRCAALKRGGRMLGWIVAKIFKGKVSGQLEEPWGAVSVVGHSKACRAAVELRGKRYLSSEAPSLPLPQCSSPTLCKCVYYHYADRRSRTFRREADRGQYPRLWGGKERRIGPQTRGRRTDDPA